MFIPMLVPTAALSLCVGYLVKNGKSILTNCSAQSGLGKDYLSRTCKRWVIHRLLMNLNYIE